MKLELIIKSIKEPSLIIEKAKRIIKDLIIKSKCTNNFFFVQIGASDGITDDYLHYYIKKYKWGGY